MKKFKTLLAVSVLGSLLAFSAQAAAGTRQIIFVSRDAEGQPQVKGIERTTNALKLNAVQKAVFERALHRTVKKVSRSVDKAVERDRRHKRAYKLTEVEVSLSLSAGAGMNDVLAVGGGGGIVLHFTR